MVAVVASLAFILATIAGWTVEIQCANCLPCEESRYLKGFHSLDDLHPLANNDSSMLTASCCEDDGNGTRHGGLIVPKADLPSVNPILVAAHVDRISRRKR